jgi:hypothetical protein
MSTVGDHDQFYNMPTVGDHAQFYNMSTVWGSCSVL